jgi:outer membrane protein TolC
VQMAALRNDEGTPSGGARDIVRWMTTIRIWRWHTVRVAAALVLGLSASSAWADAPVRRISFAEALAAAAQAPALRVAAAQVVVARAALPGAAAWPSTSISVATSRRAERLALVVSIPLPIFGTLAAQRQAAGAELAVVEAEQRTVAHDLSRVIALSWIELVRARGQVDLAREIEARERSLAMVAAQRLQAGDAPRAEVVAAEARAVSAQARVQAAQSVAAVASVALATALGWDPEIALEPMGGWPLPAAPVTDRVRLLPAHPALRAAAAMVESERSRWQLAQRQRWPKLSLDLEGLFDDPGLPGNDARIGLSVELPLFAGIGAAQSAAAARVAAARLNAELVGGQLAGAAVSARLRYVAAQQLAGALNDTVVPAQRQAAELAAVGYREGQTGLAVIIETQRGLAEAQAEALDARAAAGNAWIEWLWASGGKVLE